MLYVRLWPKWATSDTGDVVSLDFFVKNASATEGFDAANEKMTDMIISGIIDPAKVVRTALTDAAGVASLLCTAEVRKNILLSIPI